MTGKKGSEKALRHSGPCFSRLHMVGTWPLRAPRKTLAARKIIENVYMEQRTEYGLTKGKPAVKKNE